MHNNFDILRKDNTLNNTINLVSNTLKKKEIKIKKFRVNNINHKFYSTRLELKDFYNLGVNGKGLSKNAAIASAYGELMERLQTGFLINNNFLIKERHILEFDDEKVEDYNIFKKRNLDIYFQDKNYKSFFAKKEVFNVVSPFKNLITNEIKMLPIRLINATTHTNGLCAGNSMDEALCQGICEILERYCYQNIILNKLKLKKVIINKEEYIYYKIKQVEKMGFKVEIKDCSLGIFPVIGVLIKNNDKYLFTMASDSNINIAIQRCITELFQGLSSKKEIIRKMKPINNNYDLYNKEEIEINWFKCYTSNNGIHPIEIFNSDEIINYTMLPFDNTLSSNKKSLDYLTKILSSNNYEIYYNKYSQLNFDAYRIYIPGLSEIDKIKKEEFDFIINSYDIKKVIFNINGSTKSNINKTIKILKKISNIPKFKIMNVGTVFHSKHFFKSNYNNLSIEMLLILLCIKNNNPYYTDNKRIENYINKINSNNLFDYIINDLNIILPKCPDCLNCPLYKKCKYNEWKKIISKIQKK